MRLRSVLLFRPRARHRKAIEAGSPLEYVHPRQKLRAKNHVQALCCGGETFPVMIEAISQARTYVHLETYIFKADATGKRFAAALIERAQAGVVVRLLIDALGSFELPASFLAELRAGGVLVAEYHPLAPWRPRTGFNQRDHQKILILDGELGFTGGINIGDEYAAVDDGGGGWFDMHARVRGPVVANLDKLFARTWLRATGERISDKNRKPSIPPRPHMLAAVVDNFGIRNRSRKRQAYMHAIRAAKSEISLMNAYFIPDRGMRRAMRLAVRRGVRVRVIVPQVSDVPVVLYASRHLFPRLLRAGIELYEWPERMMHAKAGVIDGVWSTIGSYNLDRRSLFHNLEASIIVADAPFGARMREIFATELAKSRQVTLQECLDRSAFERARQWFCFLWRYWL